MFDYIKIKRISDLLLSIFLLIIFLPFFLIIILLISTIDRFPFIFIQIRSGINKKKFKMFKFRTMSSSTNLPDEKRITKLGRVLRKYKLDELPQLINILIGNMSFVGPRPLLIEYDNIYNLRQNKRFNVLPGITGLSQIKVFLRRNYNWSMKLNFDLVYVKKISLKLDIYIIYLTIVILFRLIFKNSEHKENFEKFN